MNSKQKAFIVIIILSIAVPGLVAVLLFSPWKLSADYAWLKSLPTFNAVINTLTAILLLIGRYYAQRDSIQIHKALMSAALFLGTIFLISYVFYHSTSTSAIFGDANLNGVLEDAEKQGIGIYRPIYLGLLLSHIGLSVVVVPFVLSAFYFALSGAIERHKAVVKYTWPIWMVVSISGVVVYLMVSPYYPM